MSSLWHNIGIADAMNSPKLFEPFFTGSSWATWRSILKATFAEPLNRAERRAFRSVAERKPPKHRVRELVAIAGRGAGKDSVASLIAIYIAISFDPRGKLRPGEKAVVMCLAVDRHQARIVFDYIRGYFEQVPALAAMVVSIGSESIDLKSGVVIEVLANNFRSVRGRSLLCCIFDECAFWRDENSATPDVETHAAVSPGLARVPGSMLILISTAHKRSGLLYQRWKDYFGRDDDDVLVIMGATRDFNPTFDAKLIDKALATDPQLYGAEYLSEWRSDLATFLGRELIDAAVDVGVTVRPPRPGIRYVSFCDPSGGGADSFAAAVAHVEQGNVAVLDCLVEIKGPLNVESATAQIAATLKSYGIRQTTSDRYAAQWPITAFARHGITLDHSERDRSKIYLEILPLFSSGRLRLLDNARLLSQFAGLERRTFPNGRERIDHGKSGHDDASNAAAGAIVLAATNSPVIWPREMIDRIRRRGPRRRGQISILPHNEREIWRKTNVN